MGTDRCRKQCVGSPMFTLSLVFWHQGVTDRMAENQQRREEFRQRRQKSLGLIEGVGVAVSNWMGTSQNQGRYWRYSTSYSIFWILESNKMEQVLLKHSCTSGNLKQPGFSLEQPRSMEALSQQPFISIYSLDCQ